MNGLGQHSERPEIWHAGPRESEILFALRHPDRAEIEGRVGRWKGIFVVDLEEPRRCGLEVIAEAASLDTGVAERDSYARSAMFLDVERFPEIRFRSSKIVPHDDDRRLTITGDLTIRESTRQIRVAIEHVGEESLWQHASKLAFRGHVSFRRLDFGLLWQGEVEGGELVASDLVDVDLSINIRRGPK